MTRPVCKACDVRGRQCEYSDQPSKPRPSKALIRAAEREARVLEQLIVKLKGCPSDQREELLASIDIVNGRVKLNAVQNDPAPDLAISSRPVSLGRGSTLAQQHGSSEGHHNVGDEDSDSDDAGMDEHEVSQYLSLDENGHISALGPTSALHNPVQISHSKSQSAKHLANQLFVNATLQRQFESSIWSFNDIDGVPIELATHLHDLHWNRQHHGFLLTYRPAYMRDLVSGGLHWSKFLSNAIFASASKYSTRPEVRDDPLDPCTSGGRFMRRCDALLAEESPLEVSSIPTVIGLMLLGTTYFSRGEVSKGWKYCGLAIRMVFDLGLHLDCERPGLSPEDVEISRRVFWGVFVLDKLQSLYLGRPVSIQLRDAHVSCTFMDTLEENEPWTPYIDPYSPQQHHSQQVFAPTPVHSVTCFQQLCSLSKIMTKIVTSLYVAGARVRNASRKLEQLDHALKDWRAKLQTHLVFEPVLDAGGKASYMLAPNIILLNTTYQAIIILLHRPFISNNTLHQGSPLKQSWDKCTKAARSITNILTAYRTAYTLRGAPYLASYACYVACTIHVRNAVVEQRRADELSANARTGTATSMLERTLGMLDELAESSPCATRASRIIMQLMELNKLPQRTVTDLSQSQLQDISPDTIADVDTIMKMFPPSIAARGNQADSSWAVPQGSSNTLQLQDQSLYALPTLQNYDSTYFESSEGVPSSLHDPLFGFMDGFDLSDERPR